MKLNDPADTDQKQPQEPQSARDTIRAAMEEHKEKAASEEVKNQSQDEQKEPEKVAPAKETEVKVETKELDKKEEKKEEPSSEKKEEVDKVKVKEEKEPKPSKSAPFGLPKAIRAKWDSADPEIQDFLARTVKENLDSKANQGRKAYLGEVDQVLAPYMPQLQQLGATPAQLVKRLLDYSDALASNDHKYMAIAKLAQDFKIDLTVFGKQQKGAEEENVDQNDQTVDYIPPELNAKLDTIISKFAQTEQSQRSANDKAAENTINQWSGFDPQTQEFKTKPFFPYVRQTMHSLIQTGTIPLVDGKIDLDGAYEAACFLHPEIREHMLEERKAKEEADREKERQQKASALARTKNAASSIRPGAPVAPISPITRNDKGKPMSVRDSLRAAMAEVRDQRA